MIGRVTPPCAGKVDPPTPWLAGMAKTAVLVFAAGEVGQHGGSPAGVVGVELSKFAMAHRDMLLGDAFGDASWR
jgi:hypothetical protein